MVPSSNVFQAMAHTAVQLNSAEIVAGRSTVLTWAEQARRLERAGEGVPNKPPHGRQGRRHDRSHRSPLGGQCRSRNLDGDIARY